MAKTEHVERAPSAPIAAILAWVLPGLGHWWIGERVRGLIFFVVLMVTFWGGIAVAGASTAVTAKGNGAWIAAQLCMGPQTFAALELGNREVRNAKAREQVLYRAPWPSSNIGVVYAGVAGLLNLLVIIDVLARSETRRMAVVPRLRPKKGRS